MERQHSKEQERVSWGNQEASGLGKLKKRKEKKVNVRSTGEMQSRQGWEVRLQQN